MKIDNYGELLAAGLNLKLLAYKEYGDYQGDYVAILSDDGKDIYLYKGSYGSCSGCDDLCYMQGIGNDLDIEGIKKYASKENPFLVIKSKDINTVLNMEDISQIFPANTRENYAEWNWSDIKKLIQESQ